MHWSSIVDWKCRTMFAKLYATPQRMAANNIRFIESWYHTISLPSAVRTCCLGFQHSSVKLLNVVISQVTELLELQQALKTALERLQRQQVDQLNRKLYYQQFLRYADPRRSFSRRRRRRKRQTAYRRYATNTSYNGGYAPSSSYGNSVTSQLVPFNLMFREIIPARLNNKNVHAGCCVK